MKQRETKEILGMSITINTSRVMMDIPDCMAVVEIKSGKHRDEQFSALAELIPHGWLSLKAMV